MDPNHVQELYCILNRNVKKEKGKKDILDRPGTLCNSTTALSYTIEQLEFPLRGSYAALAVMGGLLTVAALPALVGLCKRRCWPLLLVWTAADVLFFVALVGSSAALAPFGVPVLVPGLAAAASVAVGVLVLYCGLEKAARPQQSAEEAELTSVRGERDPLDQVADNSRDSDL
ncbi:hypothetical protein FJT64_009709 [Amphibalanus amphitrite]|uniref:Uncharacterized protein n=1 Tax=Amphibalanus amphitrite TaxID=1232801 RepID=A0A6A4VNH6_AMPAM|nr:hypothetical protein FJT64_009709 [Amphibalanus amphitrite]